MLTTGKDLEEVLRELNQRQTSWLIPRINDKDNEVKLKGITVVGKVTHRIIGLALANETNIILTSNYQELPTTRFLEKFGEVLYKEDLYVLSWDWKWLMQTKEGHSIIATMFHTDSQLVLHEDGLIMLKYQLATQITTLLDRFEDYIILSSKNKRYQDIRSELLYLILDLNSKLTDQLLNLVDTIIICSNLPNNYNRLVTENNLTFIMIDQTAIFNEISRELYYMIKRQTYLHMDFQLNTRLKIESKK